MFSDQFKPKHRLVFSLAYSSILFISNIKKEMNQKRKELIGFNMMIICQFCNHNMNVKVQL